MDNSYEIHVISNTHWDREWLSNFQETRMMLVEFFDRLLDVLDKEPGYRSYLLDSQTVPIEDYLEARPDKRECIARHVASGRLLAGPWYTCPEGFCVNGESLVRNLLYGHRVAAEFGKVMKVGHTPFSYGQNSQMPQIYGGFGIDTILFYHGVSHDVTANEFIFEGADGSRLFASQMSSGARYNFYHNVYRRVRYGDKINDREYVWTRGGLPFHPCRPERCMGHHLLLDPVTGFHEEHIAKSVRDLREAEIDVSTTRYLAFMDGHDSSLADAATLRIIEEAKQHLPADAIFHSSLPDLLEKVKAAAKDLQVLRGERRVPGPMGARMHLYHDVLSCRTRMKRLNAHAELALQRAAEPAAAVAWLLGKEYPHTLLDLAWKTLLKCHAHDSIAGTGVDDIEQDMTYRLRQVLNISDGLARRGMEAVQLRVDNSDLAADDIALTAFNYLPRPRSEVVTAAIDLAVDSGYGDFSIADAETGRCVPMQIVSRKPHHAVVNHAGDATAMMTCERAVVHFEAADVPALGYATYALKREAPDTRGSLVCGRNAMENEHLWVGVNDDGTLCVMHKETGAEFDGLHYFEDGGEAGHAWMHIEPALDSIVTSQGGPVRISLEENGPLLACYRIAYRMAIPAGLEENGGDAWKRLDGEPNASSRTEEERDMLIVSRVTLRKGARSIDVRTGFENVCGSHRLRVMFPTRIAADTCHAEGAFDVVEREIAHGPGSPWAEAVNPTFPMQRFVDVSGNGAGLAIVNDGLREYEVTSDAERTIAVTLTRAFEIALTTVSYRWDLHPEMPLSQCPGAHEFRYLIYPHAGTWAEADVYGEADELSVPLEPAQAGAHGGDLPKRLSFFGIGADALILSALKRSEDGEGLAVRVFNPSGEAVETELTFFRTVASAHAVTLAEELAGELPCCGRAVRVKAGPKKIVTVKVCFE